MNLKLFRYRERFNVVSGLSDHSLDSLRSSSVDFCGIRASIIEKHFTLSRDGGPDAAFHLSQRSKTVVHSVRESRSGYWRNKL